MEKEEALQKLKDMPLADRIAAVAADVDSKQDEFRSIDAHELASLLGIEDAGQPRDDWTFEWIVPRRPVDEILEYEEFVDELLQLQLTPERYKELCSKIDLQQADNAKILEFLTEDEKQKIEDHDTERRAEDISAGYRYAYNSIKAPNGQELTFQAFIEDDGACIDLKTPYDERDGNFTYGLSELI